MNTRDSKDSTQSEEGTARLLEQLMQIARTSALEEMASGIAHELNQPIGAIATFAQTGQRMLARPDPLISSAAEVLQHISTEALNAGEGIHRIRGLFNGRKMARIRCELAEVVEELMPVLDLLGKRAGVKLDLRTQSGLPAVSIDRRRIQHVLFTLVQNAFEAPRQSGAPSTVSLEISGDRYAVLTAVIDHGTGVSAADRDHLFRPFFTTKRHGTGLGLASCRAIIETHEGTVGFEDAEGGGARFWFRLPADSGESTS